MEDILELEIVNQSFSTKEFNITFSVYNRSGQRIDLVTIHLWWNGTDVSANVQFLGDGLYFISLDPITVTPGEDPILLNMVISASGYEDKSFETYIAVDPETLEKEAGNGAEGIPLVVFIITITSVAGGVGAAAVSLVLLRKRKRSNKVI
jgi:hypothetical protein